MANVSKPNTFSSNTTISSSAVNDNFDTIYNEFNGSIDASNLATDAVTTAKIADSNVTTAKIASDAVTVAKLADDGAKTNVKIATSVGITASTSYQAISSSLSLEAGVWMLFGVARYNCSVSGDRTANFRFYNTTDSSAIGGTSARVDSDTDNNVGDMVINTVVTLAGTKSIRAEASISATSGSNILSLRDFFAVRLAEDAS